MLDKMTIGERIRYLRQITNNITQKKLADATGISRGNLSNYETDRFKPASDAIIAIATYFGVTTDWLLTGKEDSGLKSNQNPNHLTLTDNEEKLITLFRQLRDNDKLKIEGIIEFKISEYNTQNK